MQIHELARAYQAKTDEELLQLALDSDQLTPEAHTALTGELARRRIDPAEQPKTLDQGASAEAGYSGTSATQSLAAPGGVGEFVAEVLLVYRRHFWFFVKLTLPAVVVGCIAVLVGRQQASEIARHLPEDVKLSITKPRLSGWASQTLPGFSLVGQPSVSLSAPFPQGFDR